MEVSEVDFSKKEVDILAGMSGSSERLNWWLDINGWSKVKKKRATVISEKSGVSMSAAIKYLRENTIPRNPVDKIRIAEILEIPLSFWESGDISVLSENPDNGKMENPLLVVKMMLAIEKESSRMGVVLELDSVKTIRELMVFYNLNRERPRALEIISPLIKLSQSSRG